MGPGERKEPLRLHFLHRGLPLDVLVAGISHLATGDLAGHKWSVHLHAKPLAKLAVIGQGAPDSRNRRLEFNALLNTVVHFRQPPGCILTRRTRDMQLSGCPLYYTAFKRDLNQERTGGG